MKQITKEQFYKLVDAHMSKPVPLYKADLTKSFIYDREYGVFYCDGAHQNGLSLLLAFHHNKTDAIEVAEELGLEYSVGSADFFILNYNGICYHSATQSKFIAGREGSLNSTELRLFGYNIMYFNEYQNIQ